MFSHILIHLLLYLMTAAGRYLPLVPLNRMTGVDPPEPFANVRLTGILNECGVLLIICRVEALAMLIFSTAHTMGTLERLNNFRSNSIL